MQDFIVDHSRLCICGKRLMVIKRCYKVLLQKGVCTYSVRSSSFSLYHYSQNFPLWNKSSALQHWRYISWKRTLWYNSQQGQNLISGRKLIFSRKYAALKHSLNEHPLLAWMTSFCQVKNEAKNCSSYSVHLGLAKKLKNLHYISCWNAHFRSRYKHVHGLVHKTILV